MSSSEQCTRAGAWAWPRHGTATVWARLTDTSPWTIRRNVRPCGKRGRTYVYSLEDVEAWMRGEPLAATSAASAPMRVTSSEADDLARLSRLARGTR